MQLFTIVSATFLLLGSVSAGVDVRAALESNEIKQVLQGLKIDSDSEILSLPVREAIPAFRARGEVEKGAWLVKVLAGEPELEGDQVLADKIFRELRQTPEVARYIVQAIDHDSATAGRLARAIERQPQIATSLVKLSFEDQALARALEKVSKGDASLAQSLEKVRIRIESVYAFHDRSPLNQGIWLVKVLAGKPELEGDQVLAREILEEMERDPEQTKILVKALQRDQATAAKVATALVRKDQWVARVVKLSERNEALAQELEKAANGDAEMAQALEDTRAAPLRNGEGI